MYLTHVRMLNETIVSCNFLSTTYVCYKYFKVDETYVINEINGTFIFYFELLKYTDLLVFNFGMFLHNCVIIPIHCNTNNFKNKRGKRQRGSREIHF